MDPDFVCHVTALEHCIDQLSLGDTWVIHKGAEPAAVLMSPATYDELLSLVHGAEGSADG